MAALMSDVGCQSYTEQARSAPAGALATGPLGSGDDRTFGSSGQQKSTVGSTGQSSSADRMPFVFDVEAEAADAARVIFGSESGWTPTTFRNGNSGRAFREIAAAV